MWASTVLKLDSRLQTRLVATPQYELCEDARGSVLPPIEGQNERTHPTLADFSENLDLFVDSRSTIPELPMYSCINR